MFRSIRKEIEQKKSNQQAQTICPIYPPVTNTQTLNGSIVCFTRFETMLGDKAGFLGVPRCNVSIVFTYFETIIRVNKVDSLGGHQLQLTAIRSAQCPRNATLAHECDIWGLRPLPHDARTQHSECPHSTPESACIQRFYYVLHSFATIS